MRRISTYFTAFASFGLISLVFLTLPAAGDLPEGSDDEAQQQCLTEDDLDFETCKLEHLSLDALVSICDRIGLDMDTHVFPLIDSYEEEEDEDVDDEGLEEGSEEDYYGGRSMKEKKDRTHDDYVDAAHECLLIEDEMDRMEEEDPEGLAELERSMLAEDPALLSEVVADVLKKSPELMKELQVELAREEPELFKEILEELGEGEELGDRPEILAELVAMMLAEDPDMINTLDEDVAELMAADAAAEGEGGDDSVAAGTQSDEL